LSRNDTRCAFRALARCALRLVEPLAEIVGDLSVRCVDAHELAEAVGRHEHLHGRSVLRETAVLVP
jgi:hypothetical protein